MASSAAIERTIARNLYNVSLPICIDPFQTPHGTGTPNVKQGPAEIPRSAALVGLLTHGAEMYGVRTVHLREKGLVPPSTERRQQRRRPG